MKTIRIIIFFCVALCFATSCKKDPNMTLVQKTVFEDADIRQIEVDDAWQITVVKDTLDTFVELEYSAYLEDYVLAQMNDNRLKINFNKAIYIQPGSVFTAIVHTDKIENLEISDASKVSFEGEPFFASNDTLIIHLDDESVCSGLNYFGHECKIVIEDLSHFLDFNLHSVNCEVEVKDASYCKGTFNVSSHLVAYLDQASQLITFGGAVPYGMIRLQDVSLLNMGQTETREMHVDLSSVSEAAVWATEALSGTVQEFSTLYYKGQPQISIDCSDDSQIIPL